MPGYSTTRYTKSYCPGRVKAIAVVLGTRGLPYAQFLRFLAEQIAEISQAADVVMRAQQAYGNAGGHARQNLEFLRPHSTIQGICRECIGHQRKEGLLWAELFHQWGRIAAAFAQNVYCSQRQGLFGEAQFLFSQ